MELSYQTIDEVVKQNVGTGIKKTCTGTKRLLLLGVMAGFFVAIGAQGSNFAMHGITDAGVAKTLAGVVFPLGLMMIVFLGGELFTSGCLISMAVFSKKTAWKCMVRTLCLIYISNFVGACLMAWMITHSGQMDYSGGGVGAFTIKVAMGKIGVDPTEAVISGILCNVLVCLAIFMAGAAKDIAGKCLAIFFPIFVFVISGFEHCVANMYYIPAGIFAAKNADYVMKAEELYGITAQQISALDWGSMFHNLIPVTIGNMIGGMVFVGLAYWSLYLKKES